MTPMQEAKLSTWISRGAISLLIATLAYLVQDAKADIRVLQEREGRHETEIQVLKNDIEYIKSGITEIRMAVRK